MQMLPVSYCFTVTSTGFTCSWGAAAYVRSLLGACATRQMWKTVELGFVSFCTCGTVWHCSGKEESRKLFKLQSDLITHLYTCFAHHFHYMMFFFFINTKLVHTCLVHSWRYLIPLKNLTYGVISIDGSLFGWEMGDLFYCEHTKLVPNLVFNNM